MLRTIGVDLSVADLILVIKDNTIDKIGNSKIDGVTIYTKITKSKNQDKSKDKNLVKSFGYVSSFNTRLRSGLFILKARQAII